LNFYILFILLQVRRNFCFRILGGSEESHMKGRKRLIAMNAFNIDAAGNLFNIVIN